MTEKQFDPIKYDFDIPFETFENREIKVSDDPNDETTVYLPQEEGPALKAVKKLGLGEVEDPDKTEFYNRPEVAKPIYSIPDDPGVKNIPRPLGIVPGDDAIKDLSGVIHSAFGRPIAPPDLKDIEPSEVDFIRDMLGGMDILEVKGTNEFHYGWMNVRGDAHAQRKLRSGFWEPVYEKEIKSLALDIAGVYQIKDERIWVNELMLVKMPMDKYRNMRKVQDAEAFEAESSDRIRREIAQQVAGQSRIFPDVSIRKEGAIR